MTTTLGFKDLIDIPMWRPASPAIAATLAGQAMMSDLRNNETRHPFLYLLRTIAILDAYDPTTDEWISVVNPGLNNAIAAGATGIFHPSQGPRGALSTGSNTTTKVVLSTALPAAVGVNQLANRGDGVGFRIRIIGNGTGNSGKTEERTIIANTAGTTPTIWLDSALSFTPGNTNPDSYEILSGRLFLLDNGAAAAGIWKYYDIACNVMSGNLAVTNLPTIGTDSSLLALSESYVPYDRSPGEGFVSGGGTLDSRNCIVATAADGTHITGSGMPSDLQTDEYRNFQIRIVEDATNVTAVGQRRRITGHASGASAQFTVAAWAVTPSSTAKFVVENDDDKIVCITGANTAAYNYNIVGNSWDTSTWAAPAAGGAGVVLEQAFGTTRDTLNNHRHSFIYRIRGGGVNTIDVLDIANGVNGTWSNDIAYGNKGLTTFTTGTSGVYDPATHGGRFIHIDINGTQRTLRFDMKNRILDPESYMRMTQGTAIVGQKMAFGLFIDGSTKLAFVYRLCNSIANMYSLAVQR